MSDVIKFEDKDGKVIMELKEKDTQPELVHGECHMIINPSVIKKEEKEKCNA
jgi:hypothetical protein